MAAQPANSQPAPSAQVVGNAFVEQYYHILHHSPELVFRFYQDTSVLSRLDPDGQMMTITTMNSINEKICSLDFKNYKAEIKTADAQDSFKDGVIVLVTGFLTGKDNLKRMFTQTFFLAPQDKGYYVLNDIFRYVEEREVDNSAIPITATGQVPSSTEIQDPEPAQIVDPPTLNQETSWVEEVENVTADDGGQLDAAEGKVLQDGDTVIEAKSYKSEDQVPVSVDEVASATKEDSPKKSYASILSSQTKKGPMKVYVPANSGPISSAKTEKPSINATPEAPEASVPSAPAEEPMSNDAHDEVEGHSVYIRNLPVDITIDQLEAVFKKFGPIKQNGVQVKSNKQQGFCFGFVEFSEFSSLQDAIKASPIAIGDHQVSVEIKRATTRVGGGRGRFNSSRGGFRSDSFRSRGGGGGGRTYVRSDSFRGGRGSPSGGGEAYHHQQQGRGRGYRRTDPNPNLASP